MRSLLADACQRIDYIFASLHFKLRNYAVLSDSCNGRFPSDHLPVAVQAELPGSR